MVLWLSRNQFAQYISVRGGFANADEKAYATRLLEMINVVDAEGTRVANDLARDAFKELIKSVIR